MTKICYILLDLTFKYLIMIFAHIFIGNMVLHLLFLVMVDCFNNSSLLVYGYARKVSHSLQLTEMLEVFPYFLIKKLLEFTIEAFCICSLLCWKILLTISISLIV